MKAGTIVEYQFERMMEPRLARVMDVAKSGVYILDARQLVYLPFEIAYIKERPDVSKDLYESFVDKAKTCLAKYKATTEVRLKTLGDNSILE